MMESANNSPSKSSSTYLNRSGSMRDRGGGGGGGGGDSGSERTSGSSSHTKSRKKRHSHHHHSRAGGGGVPTDQRNLLDEDAPRSNEGDVVGAMMGGNSDLVVDARRFRNTSTAEGSPTTADQLTENDMKGFMREVHSLRVIRISRKVTCVICLLFMLILISILSLICGIFLIFFQQVPSYVNFYETSYRVDVIGGVDTHVAVSSISGAVRQGLGFSIAYERIQDDISSGFAKDLHALNIGQSLLLLIYTTTNGGIVGALNLGSTVVANHTKHAANIIIYDAVACDDSTFVVLFGDKDTQEISMITGFVQNTDMNHSVIFEPNSTVLWSNQTLGGIVPPAQSSLYLDMEPLPPTTIITSSSSSSQQNGDGTPTTTTTTTTTLYQVAIMFSPEGQQDNDNDGEPPVCHAVVAQRQPVLNMTDNSTTTTATTAFFWNVTDSYPLQSACRTGGISVLYNTIAVLATEREIYTLNLTSSTDNTGITNLVSQGSVGYSCRPTFQQQQQQQQQKATPQKGVRRGAGARPYRSNNYNYNYNDDNDNDNDNDNDYPYLDSYVGVQATSASGFLISCIRINDGIGQAAYGVYDNDEMTVMMGNFMSFASDVVPNSMLLTSFVEKNANSYPFPRGVFITFMDAHSQRYVSLRASVQQAVTPSGSYGYYVAFSKTYQHLTYQSPSANQPRGNFSATVATVGLNSPSGMIFVSSQFDDAAAAAAAAHSGDSNGGGGGSEPSPVFEAEYGQWYGGIKWVGITQSRASANQKVNVIQRGISEGHSNLLPGAGYYAGVDGYLTLAQTDTYVGIAKSSTEIILDDSFVV